MSTTHLGNRALAVLLRFGFLGGRVPVCVCAFVAGYCVVIRQGGERADHHHHRGPSVTELAH